MSKIIESMKIRSYKHQTCRAGLCPRIGGDCVSIYNRSGKDPESRPRLKNRMTIGGGKPTCHS